MIDSTLVFMKKKKKKNPSWPVYFTWDIFNNFMR